MAPVADSRLSRRGHRQIHSRRLSSFPRLSTLEAPSLHRHYPASAVLRASPAPCRPGLPLAGFRLARATPPTGFPVLSPSPLPCVPPSLPRRSRPVRVSLASRPMAAFPVIRAGRPPHRPFRGLLEVHCALRPAWSLNRPWRPVAPECFSRSRYLLQPLRLLPAGATVAGRVSKSAEGRRLSTAHRIQRAISSSPP